VPPVKELRKLLRIQALRCHVIFCLNGTRLNAIPVLASRSQALRYVDDNLPHPPIQKKRTLPSVTRPHHVALSPHVGYPSLGHHHAHSALHLRLKLHKISQNIADSNERPVREIRYSNIGMAQSIQHSSP